MNLDLLIREVQSVLGLTPDGKAGPKTWSAIHDRIVGIKPPPENSAEQEVDVRSSAVIATLLPEVQPYASSLIHAAAAQGIAVKIISGTRTFEQQDALFEQGRSKGGPIVTNARGGYSNHNFGIAFDVGIFEGGKYLEESRLYAVVGSIGQSIGLEWGGNWKNLQDEPHFQLRPKWAASLSESNMLAELRHRRTMDQPVFA